MKIFICIIIAFLIQVSLSAQVSSSNGNATKSRANSDSLNIYKALIQGKQGGGIDSTQIAALDSMTIAFKDSNRNEQLNYHINSYSCIVHSNKMAYSFTSTDGNISEAIKKYALKCHKNDLIIFYNIKFNAGQANEQKIENGPVFRVL